MSRLKVGSSGSIWVFAGLYFACYVPYSGLSKTLTSGLWPGQTTDITGTALLPLSTMASVLVMLLFLTGMRWWGHAHQLQLGPIRLPVPTRGTALSGLATAVIIATTTLAYTFEGISIVFAMLLMRGGVLIIAPVIDAITGRATRWFSWIALAFAMAALVVAFLGNAATNMSVWCALDIAVYLLAYVVRLRLMSRLAKSSDPETTKKYFVEEQLMATPATLGALTLASLFMPGTFGDQLRVGFSDVLHSELLLPVLAIGALSQLVGIFGTLVFLDPRENTFSVPVNRSASILAGVVASTGLALLLGGPGPSGHQLVGAALVIAAILSLTLGPQIDRKRQQATPAAE